jgi:TRAP-type C4-dicarboxylate transport system permease small subunit
VQYLQRLKSYILLAYFSTIVTMSGIRILRIVVIALVAASFILFGWAGSYYFSTPTHADEHSGAIHPLNNHGRIHYLTAGQWHRYVWLDVTSTLAFFLALFLNWFYDPFGDLQRRWEARPPQPGERWPRPKKRPRRLPWSV